MKAEGQGVGFGKGTGIREKRTRAKPSHNSRGNCQPQATLSVVTVEGILFWVHISLKRRSVSSVYLPDKIRV